MKEKSREERRGEKVKPDRKGLEGLGMHPAVVPGKGF